jgi:hypothetical protein
MSDRREIILALDLATRFGWAEGTLGDRPISGSQRCASEGATSAEIFGGFFKWLAERMQAFRPHVLVYEAPLTPSHARGKTNINTSRILLGLPAIAEAVANRCGVPVLEARVDDVRAHYIGERRLRGAEAKKAVILRCRQLGLQPRDDNEADALALLDYVQAIRNPRHAANMALERGMT